VSEWNLILSAVGIALVICGMVGSVIAWFAIQLYGRDRKDHEDVKNELARMREVVAAHSAHVQVDNAEHESFKDALADLRDAMLQVGVKIDNMRSEVTARIDAVGRRMTPMGFQAVRPGSRPDGT
jgi:hypothetical protein